MADFYLFNPQTKLLYEVLAIDQERKMIKFKSMETGIEFEDIYDVASFKRMGYELMTHAKAVQRGLLEDE